MFDLPALLSAIKTGSPANVLPYATDPSLYSRHAEALAAAEERVRDELAQPIPELPFSKFRLFRDNGNRVVYERLYFARRFRLTDLETCLLAGRDTDGTLLTAFEDLLWEICNEYSWALPAHIWPGEKRADEITLDLFATETGFYIAEALHIFGDRLDARVTARCRRELKRRIFDSYLGDYNEMWWERGENNWGAVCAGSIGMAFLYAEKDPARRETALARVLRTMDLFIGSFPEEGTCEEGVGYWNYGFGFFTVFADFLYEFTAGKADLFAYPKIHEIALFPQRMSLSEHCVASFSDGDKTRSLSPAVNARLRARYSDMAICRAGIGTKQISKPAWRLRDFLWCDPETEATPLPDAVTFYRDKQWLIFRKAPFAFAALFGHNGVSHNHNDIGSFLLAYDEKEGPTDLGSGEYTRQYFGPERFSILCNGSQGHSVPIIGGNFQKDGRQYKAADISFEKCNGEVRFAGDIAGAYGLDTLAALKREFLLTDATLTITDTFSFTGGAPSVTERFVGYAKAEVTAPGKASFGAFEAVFDPALKAGVKTEKMSVHGGSKLVDVFLLDIELPAGTPAFTVRFTPKAL